MSVFRPGQPRENKVRVHGALPATAQAPSSTAPVAPTRSPTIDPFERLPVELILGITSYTSDFVGLESLLILSPRVRAVFLTHPRVIWDFLAQNPMTMMPGIQQRCRTIAVIHCHWFRPTDIDDYIYTCPSLLDSFPPSHTTEGEILHILHTAARIQRLACACLYTMQRNFVSAVEGVFGSEATQVAGEPLTWIEEFRVYQALWHLELYSSLRNAATSRWNWSSDSLFTLDRYHSWQEIENVWEQAWTVAGVLADLGLRASYPGHPRPELREKEPDMAAWHYKLEEFIPFFVSLHLPGRSHDSQHPLWASPLPPDSDAPRCQRIESCFRPTATALTLQQNQRLLARHIGQRVSPLMEMAPYRRLGWVIWHPLRIFSVGLLPRWRVGSHGDPIEGGYNFGDRHKTWSVWLALVEKELPCTTCDIERLLGRRECSEVGGK
jgi:hypothetical protein